MQRFTLLLLITCLSVQAFAQIPPSSSCGQQEIMQHFYTTHPQYKQLNEQTERLLKMHNQQISPGQLKTQRSNVVVTLPVVVHIIHNNGAENISDAQVLQGIQHLNEAYANSGYYDPSDGVNTQIQFCMAQRDPSNNATNGITRDVSPYTVMGGSNYYSDDLNVKDINRWNPLCYINIWLVKSIPTSVVGYAYLPSAHGSNVDGIIIEAAYFGSSNPNDVVAIHEMGHYLGLYHTFEGGCTNNDCTTDGDKVCDTPPDQSTAGISCTSSANSCTTDVLSGFATDQNDLTQDYMDYGNFNCMKVFTQGQSDRMNWFIQNVRQSLLACKSCMNPCPAPVTANFTAPVPPFIAGTSYTFTNTSVNAASYEWYVNNVLQTTSVNFTYAFPAVSSYTLKLIAKTGNVLCSDDVKTITVNVVCGVAAGFTKSAGTAAAGSNINFTNTSTGADSYEWYVNGSLQSTSVNFSYTSSIAGGYSIQLIAKNSSVYCQQSFSDTVHYTCSVTTSFTPAGATTLINVPLSFTSTGSGENSYQWFINGVASGNSSTLTHTFTTVGAYTLQLVTGNGTCNASNTAIVYVNDKCGNAQYQFQKFYAAGLNSSAIDIRTTPDGGSVLAERIVLNGGNTNAAILKLDAAGNTQWMNIYGYNTATIFKKIKATADGGYIAIGNVESPGTQGSVQTYIVKTAAAGAVSWSRVLVLPGIFSNFGNDIIQSADGSYYFTGTLEQPEVNGSSDVMAGKLDATGNLLWLGAYDARSSESGNGLAEDNNHLIVCGNKSGQLVSSGFLLQLNKVDGSTVWAQTYLSTDENFMDVQVLPTGYFVNALRRIAAGGLYTDHVYLQTDFAGKLNYSKYIQPFGTAELTQWASATVKPNGNIISQTSADFGGTYVDFIIQEVNPSSGIVWSKQYNQPASWLSTLAIAGDNSLWLAGIAIQPTAPPVQTYVMKLDSTGNAGNCPSVAVKPTLFTAAYNTGVADFTSKQIQAQVTRNDNEKTTAVVANTACQFLKCDSITPPIDTCSFCADLHINTADTLAVCSLNDSLSVGIIRDFRCPFPLQWTADPAFAYFTVVDSSSIHLIFSKAGTVTLYASVDAGLCGTAKDSIVIQIFPPHDTLNLGPDIQLCKFSTLKLSAGKGFKTYLWNDGSVDSTLTAFNPGQYFVTATDYCGNQFRDTINLSLAPDVPFDLGPDRQICNHDTLTITAPGNFAAYSWAVNYNINTIKGAAVRVWPAKDTTYTVVATVATGCTVTDTIRISIKQTPLLQLGNDTSFCAGTNLVLQAPAGFTGYLWQDGTTGTDLIVSQKGIYWLQATAANGCIAKDTLQIINVYPLPSGFLPPTASICNGKILELKASGNWPSYLWYNNATTPSVTVTTAGKYWLQVTSANGCSAKDSISVTANACASGIHFPNAFTPDNNGNNDTYKPVVYDIPVNYRLRIYNRYGEKVFETTDFKQGWDGWYRGRRQPPDTFVWYCVYQFTGSLSAAEKGTLILVR